MTNAVNGNQYRSQPQNDDWEMEDIGELDGDFLNDIEDGDSQDRYSQGDSKKIGGTVPLTYEDARSLLKDLQSSAPQNREVPKLLAEIGHQKGPLPQALAGKIYALQAESLESGERDGVFQDSAEQFISEIEGMKNLDEEEKEAFQSEGRKLLHQMELHPNRKDVQEQFKTFQEKVNAANTKPSTVKKMEETTGLSHEEIVDLFKKYDLDPANLPQPPNAQVAALLNDPAFENLTQMRDEVKSASAKFDEATGKLKDECEKYNDKAKSDDPEKEVCPSFKKLYDETQGKGPAGKALMNARSQLAGETAKILTVLYGTKATADDNNPGVVTMGQSSSNVVNNSTGQIQFSKEPGWPQTELPKAVIPHGVDKPSWMNEAKYPTEDDDNRSTFKKTVSAAVDAGWEGAVTGFVLGGPVGAYEGAQDGAMISVAKDAAKEAWKDIKDLF
ncbi:MAG: hypothetical protein U1F57_03145 [bacterium]